MTLSNITTLSSFTDKAPASPEYFNAKFAEVNANFRTLAASGSTWVGDSRTSYNIKSYGAVGDGSTDDTAAIRAAYAAAVAGGKETTVLWPITAGERYSITSDIRVSATFPIHSLMDGSGGVRYNATSPAGVVISSDLSYALYYTYPTSRGLAGGGSIRGFRFWSDTFRGRHVHACIYAKDMGGGTIEDVQIKGIRGGGILTEMFVQATINRPQIFYSGTTDLPPIKLGESVSNQWVTQSAQVLDGRFEVNSGTTYIVLTTPLTTGGNQGSNTIAFCQFESDSNDSTEWPYIDCDHHKTRIVNCGFNRNKHTHVHIRSNNGNDVLFANSISDGDSSANSARWIVAGQRVVMNNLISRGATSNTSVQVFVTGNQWSMSNVQIVNGGSLRFTGQLGVATGLNIGELDTTRPAAVELGTLTTLADSVLWNSTQTTLPSISTAGISTWHYDGVLVWNLDNNSATRALRSTFYPIEAGYGTQAAPSFTFRSEQSVGFYRSGVSTVAMSTGTFNLATNAVRLSVRSLAMASLTSANVAVNEICFAVGASGCSLAFRSGGTMWYPNSSLSTVG